MRVKLPYPFDITHWPRLCDAHCGCQYIAAVRSFRLFGRREQLYKSITGEDFTAKDFRTWAGTLQTTLALDAIGSFDSEAEAKRNIVAAIKDTAKSLGNRPATCRAYYVHPAVIEAYLDGTLPRFVKQRQQTESG
jgi:DNA topoisomerase IB